MPAIRFDRERLEAAFARGEPLLERPGYKVHASRREAPGEAELHRFETDVFYVLEGEAVLVAGGRMVEPAEIEPGQIRGTAIEGGTEHRLAGGDLIVIPADEPHWFREVVRAPFVYLVVKAIASG